MTRPGRPQGLIAALLGLVLSLQGCATDAPQVVPAARVVVQRVEVPVDTPRKPPDAVLGCWYAITPYRGYKLAPGGWLVPTADTAAFMAYLAAHQTCDARWRAWATAP